MAGLSECCSYVAKMEGRDKSSTETKLRRRRAGTRKQKAWPAFGSGMRDQTAMTLHVPQIAGARMQHAGADQAETLLSHERVSCMCDKNRGLPFVLHKRRLVQVLAARAAMGQVAQRPPRPATSRGIYLERSGRCTYLPPRRRRLLGAREAKAQPCAKKTAQAAGRQRAGGTARSDGAFATTRRPQDSAQAFLAASSAGGTDPGKQAARQAIGRDASIPVYLFIFGMASRLGETRGGRRRGCTDETVLSWPMDAPGVLRRLRRRLQLCRPAMEEQSSLADERRRGFIVPASPAKLQAPRPDSLSKILPAFSAAQPASAQRAFALIGALLLPAEVPVTPTSHSLISRRR